LGDFERAQKYFEELLRLDEKISSGSGIAVALECMADLQRVQGKFTQAEANYQKAIQLSIDNGISYAYALYGLSLSALGQNHYELARDRFTEFFERTHDQTEKTSACDFLMGLAAVSAGLDELERSAKLYGAAQAIMTATSYKYPSYDMAEFERHIQLARQQLAETFKVFVEEGRSMTLEQAIEFALENNYE
jgi:tetratricopeptide (TPR) repeat protein